MKTGITSTSRAALGGSASLAALAALAALSLLLAGCGGSTAPSGGSSSAAQVGFSAAVLDNPFTVQLVDTVQVGGKAGGFDMVPTVKPTATPPSRSPTCRLWSHAA